MLDIARRALLTTSLGAAAFAPSAVALAQDGEGSGQVAGAARSQPSSTPALSPTAAGQPETAAEGGASDLQKLESRWRFTLSPYLWAPWVDGTLSVNGNDLDVDSGFVDTGDTESISYNMALMLRAELSHDRLSLLGDGLYLNMDAPRQGVLADQNARLKLGLYELGAAYSILDTPPAEQSWPRVSLEPLAGLRIYDVDARITGSGVGLDTSASKLWMDGMVGARARLEFNRTLALYGRADVGFGGSDLSWSARCGLDIRLCETASLELGYRALDVEFANGSGADEFNYDLLLHGPFVAVTIRF